MNFKIALPIIVSLFLIESTFAMFVDSAQNTNNTFSAAAVFPTVTPTPSPSPTNIADHLVISEVQIDGGPSHAEQDFIELYNPTNSAIDLNGFRLVKRTGNSSTNLSIKSWTSTALVQSHGYYLWANGSETAFPSSISADTSTTVDLTASSTVALRNGDLNTGTLIDVLSWNSGSTLVEGNEFSPNPGAGQSLERKAYSTSNLVSMISGGADELKGNGFDLGDNATDFILRTASQPQNSTSPTETP